MEEDILVGELIGSSLKERMSPVAQGELAFFELGSDAE